MRTCAFVGTMVGILLTTDAGTLPGDPDKKIETEPIDRLIKQLGDDDFTKRESASETLAKFGEAALGALRKAADSSIDVEVRVRASRLVEAIENDQVFVFNGRNLSGWLGLSECWTIKDGALVGSTPPTGLEHNTFLCSKRTHTDFELKFQVKLTGTGWTGNSGVQIRSEIIDKDRFVVKGPQCDMGAEYWGSLWGERFGGMMKAADAKLVQSVLKENEFNDYYIKCVGKRVTIKLNGTTTVDDDIADLPESGVIAWQLHGGGPMTVTFKDIEFKDLSRK